MRSVNAAGVNLIKRFEGIVDGNPRTVNLDPYIDPVGILTIGWGHALTFGERFLRNNPADWALARKMYPNGITRAEAEALLVHDLNEHSRDIKAVVGVPLNDNQFAALASFVFNIGMKAFLRSSLLKSLRRKDYAQAATRFAPWRTAGGRVLPGLVKRRAAETGLFQTPVNHR